MNRHDYADKLDVCIATIDNYTRALRDQGKPVTLATLRSHQRRMAPGRTPDTQRISVIKRMRDRQRMTWSAIGDVWGFSGSRACAIYRGASR